MKVRTLFKATLFLFVLLLTLAFVGCETVGPNGATSSSGSDSTSNSTSDSSGSGSSLADKYAHITIAEAIAIAQEAGETATTEKYVIVGTISKVNNAMYGEMTVADESGELYVYGSMAADGTYYDKMTERPVKGDQIVLEGVLKTYNGTPQMADKNNKAIILDWEKAAELPVDPDQYTKASLSEARAAEKGAQLSVKGVVAKIAYANGMKPCGFILIDETSSIYVYDGDAAQQVKEGATVELLGVKDYWILESEQTNAAVHGYSGACQLSGVTVVSVSQDVSDFDKAWIQKTTVKELISTPFEEDITSLVYEVTALVKENQGAGFVNYYIDDLDGVTGSYVYTQCNGSDFAWLKPFDGKVCKVYLTALNAKSTASECFYRLLPIAVEELAAFSFPESDVPEFAIEYAVADLLSSEPYGADPAIELPISYFNEIIAAFPVAISYASDNEAVATVSTDTPGAAILNLLENGTATITVTATYNGQEAYTATREFTVTLNEVEDIQTPTVAEVLTEDDGTLVKVRGIVMSSVVNQDAFYLGDETGMIAVYCSGETIALIHPGDEVVFEGYKVHVGKGGVSASGQCIISGSATSKTGATLLANYYGNNDYSTAYFDDTMTIEELYDLDINTDYTNNVYKVSAKIVVERTAYYSNILIQDENGTKQLRLYCNDANQYSWLLDYEGQVVELELAVCNWNSKNYYTGCIISVTVNGEKVVNTLNFSK